MQGTHELPAASAPLLRPGSVGAPPRPRPPTRPGPLSKRWARGWVLEAAVIGAVCYLYETMRNAVAGGAAAALHNAKALTALEQSIGIYQERAFQHVFLSVPIVVESWNFYYDTAHFLVPLAVGIFLYLKAPWRFVRMRNMFFIMVLGLAQLAWLVLPITPPKWMPESYGFVDTQVHYQNLGPQKPVAYSSDGELRPDVFKATGNPYGGLPSHHASWALFSVIAVWPVVRRRWVKGLLVAHLLATAGAIVVTGNHRFIDIAGSIIEVTVAFGLAVALERALAWRRARRAPVAPALAAG